MPKRVLVWVAALSFSSLSAAVAALPPAPAAEPPPVRSLSREDLFDPGLPVEELLDLLAPLGAGAGNAAGFFAALRPGAAGDVDLAAALDRAQPLDLGIDRGPALKPGEPLLLAAGTWTLQAECAFFPDAVPFVGWNTWRVDEDLALLFARSWVAEARATGEPEPARRAVRLGRLLLQEGVWFEQVEAGRRSIVLGINELRRQAQAQERWPEVIACTRVLARVQFDWIRSRGLSASFASRQGHTRTAKTRVEVPFSVASFEQRLGRDAPGRLRTVSELWRATGPAGGDAESRAAAAELLGDWARRDDPVVSASATWWSARPWSADAPVMQPEPPAELDWASEAPGDPVERWMGDRIPRTVEWKPPPSRSSQRARPAAPCPEAWTRAHPNLGPEIRARLTWGTLRNGRRQQVLPADDPLLVAMEAWVLGGGKVHQETDDPLLQRGRDALLFLVAGSLPDRAASLRGSPEATRALDALERLLLAERERELGWWSGRTYHLWRDLDEQRSAEFLMRGEGAQAASAAASAMAHELTWWWTRELIGPLGLISDRPIKRGLFGFGPARGKIEDADLDLCERFAGERSESEPRMHLADTLFFISHVGSFGQRRRAERLLIDLSKDSNVHVAAHATELLDAEFTQQKKDLDTEIVKALDSLSDGARSLFGE